MPLIRSTRDEFARDFGHHNIEVRRTTGGNLYGEQQYTGSPEVYERCFVQETTERAITEGGEEFIADLTIHIFSPDEFSVDDEVTFETTIRKPMRVDRKHDDREAHHSVLFFGRLV